MNVDFIINFSYIISSILFAFGLKFLGSPVSARRGNLLSAAGMLLAVLVTLLSKEIISFQWILLGLTIGSAAGIFVAFRAAMTQMPEMVALLHGCGGLASVFVDWSAYHTHAHAFTLLTVVSLYLSIIIGGITFTGSVIAWGKLSERLPGRPLLFIGQRWINILVLAAVVICGIIFIPHPEQYSIFLIIFGLSLLLGVLLVIPIGGADMPVVISVLNSYSGLVACTTGFVIN
ncbi:MAG: NAD(P)(+) transhydrogenase (Re/Si-specific) subunit beta, partial [Candidatus Omnitrophica bacterium]|nr:NAD(P)(+) transhydrogenase (Re/Si-specific) subunit beta [Candidatus Omnitrophota bacterium]